MTRETKVGLVIGLGVILLVGIFVSDYLRIDQTQDSLPSGEFADFNGDISNSPPSTHTPIAEDSGLLMPLAAAVLDDIENHHGEPTDSSGQPTVISGRMGPSNGFDSQRAGHMGTALAGDYHANNSQELFVEPMPVPLRPSVDGPQLDDPPVVTPHNDTNLEQEQVIRSAVPVIHHVVKENQTLSGIARQYYEGNSNMWISIRDANENLVGPEGQVRVGATLVIPKRSEGTNIARPRTAIHDENARTPGTSARRLMITVKEGDTLSELAQTHLGSAGKWQEFLDANSEVLTDARHLRAGMRLRVPIDPAVLEQANHALEPQAQGNDTEPATPPRPQVMQTYTVKSGDSLYSIAASTLGNGSRYDDIFQANRDKLADADAIKEGMVLNIPGATTASAN